MNDVKAAAERLRKTSEHNDLAFGYRHIPFVSPATGPRPREWHEAWNADMHAVVAAYLREHDETPIDEAWLRSVGFTDGTWHMFILANGNALVAMNDRKWEWCGAPLPTPETRGQLRRLCAAIGIELREE